MTDTMIAVTTEIDKNEIITLSLKDSDCWFKTKTII